MAEQGSQFKDRLWLDEAAGAWMDQTRRYMLLRPEALMGIFRALPPQARADALAAFAASVATQGGDSARAYRAMAGSGDKLPAVIAESAPQLGWGRWRFEVGSERLGLEVANSPFAAGFGRSDAPVCHAITGMLQAVAGMVIGEPVIAREIACAAMGAPHCRFEAVKA